MKRKRPPQGPHRSYCLGSLTAACSLHSRNSKADDVKTPLSFPTSTPYTHARALQGGRPLWRHHAAHATLPPTADGVRVINALCPVSAGPGTRGSVSQGLGLPGSPSPRDSVPRGLHLPRVSVPPGLRLPRTRSSRVSAPRSPSPPAGLAAVTPLGLKRQRRAFPAAPSRPSLWRKCVIPAGKNNKQTTTLSVLRANGLVQTRQGEETGFP